MKMGVKKMTRKTTTDELHSTESAAEPKITDVPFALEQFNLEHVEASLPDYVRALKGRSSGIYEDIVGWWMTVDRLTAGTKINRLWLGEAFRALRDIYSDRNIGGNRRTSGHGTFERECQQRGYKPRTVRDLIADYEAFLSGKPSAAKKRKARQQRTPAQSLMQVVSRIADLGEDLQALEGLSPDEIAKCEASVKVLTNVITRAKESSCQMWTPLTEVEQHRLGGIQ
jgi:hypothetical protein